MNESIKCWRCNVMAVNGLAGAGTLVRYGDDSNDCNTVRLQFDAGRGTTMRLSQLGVSPGQVTAIFLPMCILTMRMILPTWPNCAGISTPMDRSWMWFVPMTCALRWGSR